MDRDYKLSKNNYIELNALVSVLRGKLKDTVFADLDLHPLNVVACSGVLIDRLKKDVWQANKDRDFFVVELQKENERLRKAYTALEEKMLAEQIMNNG